MFELETDEIAGGEEVVVGVIEEDWGEEETANFSSVVSEVDDEDEDEGSMFFAVDVRIATS